MCQEMPTVLYTRWQLQTDFQKFQGSNQKIANFGNVVLSYLHQLECTIESYYTFGETGKGSLF